MEKLSIEQMCRNLLEQAINDGLVQPAPNEWGDLDPQRRSAGEKVGMANLLARYLRKPNEKELLSDLELEVQCDICDGRGGERDGRSGWWKCKECHGSGFVPTKAGEKILLLVRHHLLGMIEEEKGR